MDGNSVGMDDCEGITARVVVVDHDDVGALRGSETRASQRSSVEVHADEIGDVPGSRPSAELGQRAGLLHLPALDHDDARRHRERVDRVVRDDDARAFEPFERAAQLAADLNPSRRIQCGKRLVEQQ